MTSIRVRSARQAAMSCCGATKPRRSPATLTTRTPLSSRARSGRVTALCSMLVVTTRSPGARNPNSARFSAAVPLAVKTTRAGSPTPNSSATDSRAARTTREASRLIRWAPRPGLPATSASTVAMAAATPGGFGKEVAALSR